MGYKFSETERSFFAEFYKLCEKYWNITDTDEYWNGMIRDTEDLNKRYKELQPLTKEIIVGFVCGLTLKRDGGSE